MPSRRALPMLSLFSRRSKEPTPAPSPPSPDIRTASTPLTPPARLHLRNILPSTPDGMPTPPPPPREPRPWIWRCHSCHTAYRLSCTRRCLNCSHSFCLSSTPQNTSRGKKRRRSSGMCTSEFDYSGWADWGAWRRKVLGLDVNGRATKHFRDQAFAERTHNCMIDCNYPSECHHERYRLHTEALQKRLVEPAIEESQSGRNGASSDDHLPLNEAREIEEDDAENDGNENISSPRNSSGETSFPQDESRKAVDKVWLWLADTKGHEDRKIETMREAQQVADDGLGRSAKASRSGIDATGLVSDVLQALLREDEGMMPLETTDYGASPRRDSILPNREHRRYSNRLTVRNPTAADECEEDQDGSTVSDFDGISMASFAASSLSSSSSSSSEGEMLVAGESETLPESTDEVNEDESEEPEEEPEEEMEHGLQALIRAKASILRY